MRLPLRDRGEAPPRMLSEAFSGRSNSFGFLRWVLATMVVVGHSYPLGGFGGGTDPLYDLSGGQESFGGLAVSAFFIISGFLITRSWRSHPRVGRFLWHRVLRIFPAFWVCLLVTAFVLAPLVFRAERGTLDGFPATLQPGPLNYVLDNALLTMNQYVIGDLLTSTPYGVVGGGAWNGSLWTLWYEFGCYLVVAVLGVAGVLARHRGVVLTLAVSAYLATIVGQVQPELVIGIVPALADTWIPRFLFLFLLGSVIALYADRIEIDDRLGVLAVAVACVTVVGGGWIALGYPALAYVLIWLAVRLPLAGFDRPGDFSYGTYIYGFPLQMVLAQAGLPRFGFAAYAIGSVLATAVAAALSWYLIEKHALRLKSWTPRLRRRPPATSANSSDRANSADAPVDDAPSRANARTVENRSADRDASSDGVGEPPTPEAALPAAGPRTA